MGDIEHLLLDTVSVIRFTETENETLGADVTSATQYSDVEARISEKAGTFTNHSTGKLETYSHKMITEQSGIQSGDVIVNGTQRLLVLRVYAPQDSESIHHYELLLMEQYQ